MRKKLSPVAAALIAATISVAAASPAQAQPPCASNIPVVAYVCHVLDDEPGKVIWVVYCTLWPPCS